MFQLPENIVNWSNIQNKLLKVKLDDDTLHNNESLKSTYLNVENPEILNLDPVIEEKTSLECNLILLTLFNIVFYAFYLFCFLFIYINFILFEISSE